jgi:cyclic pyranopterin phosphate synthase
MSLTHVTDKGVKMVEVTEKPEQKRYAKASGRIELKPETLELIKKGRVEKGNVLTCAQVAAVMAVKKTPSIIPMCHPIAITGVDVDFNLIDEGIEALVGEDWCRNGGYNRCFSCAPDHLGHVKGC